MSIGNDKCSVVELFVRTSIDEKGRNATHADGRPEVDVVAVAGVDFDRLSLACTEHGCAHKHPFEYVLLLHDFVQLVVVLKSLKHVRIVHVGFEEAVELVEGIVNAEHG